jgi:hypothetical protein
MADLLEREPGLGAVACRLLNEDGSIQRVCRRFPTFGTLLAAHTSIQYRPAGRRLLDRLMMKEWGQDTDRLVDQPAAACLMIRREALERVGLFDEGLFLLYNDVDLCKRIRRAGYGIHYRASLVALHQGSASLKRFAPLRRTYIDNVIHYVRKHYGPWMGWAFAFLVAADAARLGRWDEALEALRHA